MAGRGRRRGLSGVGGGGGGRGDGWVWGKGEGGEVLVVLIFLPADVEGNGGVVARMTVLDFSCDGEGPGISVVPVIHGEGIAPSLDVAPRHAIGRVGVFGARRSAFESDGVVHCGAHAVEVDALAVRVGDGLHQREWCGGGRGGLNAVVVGRALGAQWAGRSNEGAGAGG